MFKKAQPTALVDAQGKKANGEDAEEQDIPPLFALTLVLAPDGTIHIMPVTQINDTAFVFADMKTKQVNFDMARITVTAAKDKLDEDIMLTRMIGPVAQTTTRMLMEQLQYAQVASKIAGPKMPGRMS